MASAPINTSKVTGRRELLFTSIDDIRTDVEKLATCKEVTALGNWSSGQVLQHLALVMNGCIDGNPDVVPRFVRFFLRLLFKRRFLTKPMPAGFQLPAAGAALVPGPTTWEEGLANFRRAIARLDVESERARHPALGPLTRAEWDQMHCRHSELHLSFLVPVYPR